MKRTAIIATAAGVALAVAPGAAASRPAGDETLQVVAKVHPLDGGRGQGLVHIGGRPGEPPRARAILSGLPSAQEQANMALAPAACDQYATTRPAQDINDIYIFASPPVRPGGTALVSAPDGVDLDELRRAKSVLVLGEPGEDGEAEVAACGDNEQHVVDWGGTSRRGVFATAALLGNAGGPHVLAVASTSGTSAVMLTDLLPHTDYGLGEVRSDRCGGRPRERLRFTTDATGSALLAASAGNPRGLGDHSALAVARPTADGLEPVACAPFEGGTLIG